MSPRWKKLLSDVRVARGRFIGIAIAMSLTIASVAAILSARAILVREMNRNYLDTVPASAILALDVVDQALLDAVRIQPGVIAAERDATVTASIQIQSGRSMPILLRVVPDFAKLEVAKFYPQAGAWPPALNEVLIERSVARMMPIDIGTNLMLELPSGPRHELRIAGSVHDPGNPPAWQERTVYGYITSATLAKLDGDQPLNQLNVVLDKRDMPSIEAATRTLALWLRARGHTVHFIRIPPPGAHPHQWQIDSVSSLLLCFGLLGVVLETALLAIVLGGLLDPQVRQIAVMKAIGARTLQIVGMYSTLVAVLASVALLIGLPAGLYAGHQFADFIADLLNFNISSHAAPPWIYSICIVLGLLIPLVATLIPIASVARKSVRESIDYCGVTSTSNNQWLQKTLNGIRVKNVSLQLALRSFSRRRSQLALALALLTLTGAVFITSGNVLRLWQIVTANSIAEMRYDVEVSLRRKEPEARVLEVIRSVAGVATAESSIARSASVADNDGFSFSTKSVLLRSVPVLPQTQLPSPELLAGRWFREDDRNAVVLNTAATAGAFSGTKVGDVVTLLVNKRLVQLQVVGIAREVFSSAAGYTTLNMLDEFGETPGQTSYVRVTVHPGANPDTVAKSVKQALEMQQFPARRVSTKADATAGIDAHTYMLIAVLTLIVTAVAKVATAGLASCMSTAVIERTREFGVMRTLGARAYHIQNSVLIEALMIGLVSWLLAVALAIPLTMMVNQLLTASLNRPLPLVISPLVLLLWLIGVALVATIASMAPAKRAAGLTIRQSITQL